jgi:hypothetical protein
MDRPERTTDGLARREPDPRHRIAQLISGLVAGHLRRGKWVRIDVEADPLCAIRRRRECKLGTLSLRITTPPEEGS